MNTLIYRGVTPFAFGAALLTLGCDRSADAPERPGGGYVPTPIIATKQALADNEQAIRAIAVARCEREARCAKVGVGKKWANEGACRDELVNRGRGSLGVPRCPGGIFQKELDECLREVRGEDCKNPLDTLERLAACRSGDMCKANP
jgi:Family of unknown function (DUF6184)